MKSSILAFLRTLVLPYGATTGTRIVLDGINGVIQVYDAGNNLIEQLDATGFLSTDPITNSSTKIVGSKVTWQNVPPGGSTISPGYIQAVGGVSSPELLIVAPSYNNNPVASFIQMQGGDGNVVGDTMMLLQAQQIDLSGGHSFINIDESGQPGIYTVWNGTRSYIITALDQLDCNSNLTLGGASALIPGCQKTYSNLSPGTKWKATLCIDSSIGATAGVTNIGELWVNQAGGGLVHQTGDISHATGINTRAPGTRVWTGVFAAGGTLVIEAHGRFTGGGGVNAFFSPATTLQTEIVQ